MAIIDNFSKEELKKIVESSNNYHEVSVKLGYSKSATAKKQIVDRCKKFEISLDNLDYNNKKNLQRTLTEEDIFIENSTVSQASLRRHYKKNNYSNYNCAICGLEPFWNGQELNLILDHINGNNTDNRIENLRWVCPNCDHQLPTFCSKNIKYSKKETNINYCIDCGKEISIGAIRCNSCRGLYLRKVTRPTKEELFNQLVQLKGNFTQVGKKYNVSDNAVRKWAKSYGIPSYSKDYKDGNIKLIN